MDKDGFDWMAVMPNRRGPHQSTVERLRLRSEIG